MRAPFETARQASAREAREEEKEDAREAARERQAARSAPVEEAPKEPREPRPVRVPASMQEEWANLRYTLDVYLASKSDETLGRLTEQVKAFDARVQKDGK